MSEPVSGFARALAALPGASVDIVVVGVNFYARTPADAYTTLDIDAFVVPTADNLLHALSVLAELGYSFESGSEPFVDLEDPLVLRRVVERGASLSTLHPASGEIELLRSIAGFDYRGLAADAANFEVSGERVRVGRTSSSCGRSERAQARGPD